MDAISDHTSRRLALVRSSGFETEQQLAQAVLAFVRDRGEGLLQSNSLSAEQDRGVRSALNDTPVTYNNLVGLIDMMPSWPDELKYNLTFLLVKLMDDLLSLGALASHHSNKSFSVVTGKQGGSKSGARRRKDAEDGWKAKARPAIVEARRQHPEWSQDKVVAAVEDALTGLPVARIIKNLVSQMEQSGQVPRRKIRPAA